MKKTIKCIFVAVFLFGLASCTMLPASMQPDHTVIANIKAGTSINPTRSGHASPLYVMLYQLKEPSAFNAANFFDLYDKPQSTLGQDYLGAQRVYVKPGQKFGLSFPVQAGTKYIGVVAAYQNIQHAQWRTVVKLNSSSGTESIWVNLDSLAVSANGE